MPKAELNPCDVCSLRTTNELNFLLNCCICNRGFHHRCCRPPIRDEVLTSLINATLKNKPGKGVKFWKCHDCREGRGPTATSQPVPPGLSASSSSEVSKKKRKQDDIIVISDDEDQPNKEIVISSRPPARKRDSQNETRHSPFQTVQKSVLDDSKDRHSQLPQNHDLEVDHYQDPPPPSTSRFGLLSPPASISGTSARYTSTTPFFDDDDKRDTLRAEPCPETTASSRPIPPTPPISARTESPLVQERSVLSSTSASNSVRNDLRLFSKDFKDTYYEFAVPQPAVERRKPRKPVAKGLDKNARTPSQRSFFYFGTP